MLIHAADAPPHGSKYGAFGDKHTGLVAEEGGDPASHVEELAVRVPRARLPPPSPLPPPLRADSLPRAPSPPAQNLGVHYVFVRMDSSTAAMEEEFAGIYARKERAALFSLNDLVDERGETLVKKSLRASAAVQSAGAAEPPRGAFVEGAAAFAPAAPAAFAAAPAAFAAAPAAAPTFMAAGVSRGVPMGTAWAGRG